MRLPLSARVAALCVLLVGVFAVLWLVPTDTYIFLPHKAQRVDPLVQVAGERHATDGGGIYFVDVLVRKATLLERIAPSIHDGATLVPASQLRPPGVSDRQRRREELLEMRRSQHVAAAVALRALGYDVVARPIGARIEAVDPNAPAGGKLQAEDVVIGADGHRVRTAADLRRLLNRRPPGSEVRLAVLRSGKRIELTLRTVPTGTGANRRAIIGVFVGQAARIELPLKVEIDSGNVGGPSAGLAFALDLVEELGRDVDHGYRVGVTGSIELDGAVGPVGGVRQKAIGVRRSKLDVFLVPAGDNARDARKYAGDVRVIPVKTFQQALRALATLPRKRQE